MMADITLVSFRQIPAAWEELDAHWLAHLTPYELRRHGVSVAFYLVDDARLPADFDTVATFYAALDAVALHESKRRMALSHNL